MDATLNKHFPHSVQILPLLRCKRNFLNLNGLLRIQSKNLNPITSRPMYYAHQWSHPIVFTPNPHSTETTRMRNFPIEYHPLQNFKKWLSSNANTTCKHYCPRHDWLPSTMAVQVHKLPINLLFTCVDALKMHFVDSCDVALPTEVFRLTISVCLPFFDTRSLIIPGCVTTKASILKQYTRVYSYLKCSN